MRSHLDQNSMFIVSKYFNSESDYLNVIQVSSKFSTILNKYTNNPISTHNKKLFPSMTVQHIHSESDILRIDIKKKVNSTDSLFVDKKTSPRRLATFILKDHSSVKPKQNVISKNVPTEPESRVSLFQSNNFITGHSKRTKSTHIMEYERNVLLKKDDLVIPNMETTEKCGLPLETNYIDFGINRSENTLKKFVLTGAVTIPQYCFEDKIEATCVFIPTFITEIECYAFSKCKMKTMKIADNVISIKNNAFSNCSELLEITLPKKIKEISNGLLDGCLKITKVILPDTPTSIGSSAFANCHNLENLSIPQSVIKVKENAFSMCNKLKELVFNETCVLTKMTFNGCTSLTNLVVPTLNGKVRHSIDKEEVNVFSPFYPYITHDDSSINSFKFTENSGDHHKSVCDLKDLKYRVVFCQDDENGFGTFDEYEGKEAHKIKVAYIGEDTTRLDQHMFYGMSNLEEVVLSPLFNVIPKDTFKNMRCLRNVFKTFNITKIQSGCFANCVLLQKLDLKNLMIFEENSITGCSSLTSFELPNINRKIAFKVTAKEAKIIEKCKYHIVTIVVTLPEEETELLEFINEEHINTCTIEIRGKCPIIGKKNMKYIIPNNVTKIGNNFFDKGIKKIDLGNVREIGNCCFGEDVEAITLPSTLTHLGTNVFSLCSKLKSISCNNKKGFDAFVTISDKTILEKFGVKIVNVIQIDNKEKVSFNARKDHENDSFDEFDTFAVPDFFQILGEKCFSDFHYLKTIDLPPTITQIESLCFKNCYSLDTIRLPVNLKSIGHEAFSECSSLTLMCIPNGVTYVGHEAFSGCVSLKNVFVPKCVYTEPRVFLGCTSLVSVVILESTCDNEIFNSTYVQCSNLKTFDIPKNITKLESYGFCGMGSLEKLILPNAVISIGNFSFLNCSSLCEICIGKNLECIGGHAFENCINLNSISIPEAVTFIGSYAFKNCVNLTCFKCGESIQNISKSAFSGCLKLSTFIVGQEHLSQISFPVSYEVSQLLETKETHFINVFFTRKDVKPYLIITNEDGKRNGQIPQSVTHLDECCFFGYKDDKLSVEIGKNIKSIGRFCFSNSINENNIKITDISSVEMEIDSFHFVENYYTQDQQHTQEEKTLKHSKNNN
ncbi:hypothetical protein EIN_087670 [Entamoeba invadens IP1]|uniref:hypothetical protein n=1 Tax=Entamoeba invadens IP1 TaxID=370355 RepID=UPI0002C3E16E|nr:hypothetical protein EIN_087670 [Entamoeba invadens IP1]ELP85445.1 hypothetical protein EIN_087670 [Entamoeba invadens IP1]|eukprot:XP_004184791.1 hypothetical protein EIN_087670 [Entamoeba invadens IP1]